MQNLHSANVLFASTLVAHHGFVPGSAPSLVHLIYCLPVTKLLKGNTHSLKGAETEMAILKKYNGGCTR